MCGLFASADPIKLENLFNLNFKRGQKGFSQSGFSFVDGNMLFWEARNNSKKLEIDPKYLSDYNICHVVAPTTADPQFHPAVRESQPHESEGFTALWHNGILKQETIDSLRGSDEDTVWDTQLMVNQLHYLNTQDEVSAFLSKLDGSFACLMLKDSSLYVFRNALSPLFYDNMLNFSSVKFSFSQSLPAGIVYIVDFETRSLIDSGAHFETLNNPYNVH